MDKEQYTKLNKFIEEAQLKMNYEFKKGYN